MHRAKTTIERLLGFIYLDKLQYELTIEEAEDVQSAAYFLGLKNTSLKLEGLIVPLKTRLRQRIMRDFQLKKYKAV